MAQCVRRRERHDEGENNMPRARSRSPAISPSSGRLTAARPKRRPEASAIAAQAKSCGHAVGRWDPRAPNKKARKTRTARPMPRLALSRQSGWFDTGSPKRNFEFLASIFVEAPIAAHGSLQVGASKAGRRPRQDLPKCPVLAACTTPLKKRAWFKGEGRAPSRMRPLLGQPTSPIHIFLPGRPP